MNSKLEEELMKELDEQYLIIDNLREENKKLIATNSTLIKKIEELKK